MRELRGFNVTKNRLPACLATLSGERREGGRHREEALAENLPPPLRQARWHDGGDVSAGAGAHSGENCGARGEGHAAQGTGKSSF